MMRHGTMRQAIWWARWRLLRGVLRSFLPATQARKHIRLWGTANAVWYDLEDYRNPSALAHEWPQRTWR